MYDAALGKEEAMNVSVAAESGSSCYVVLELLCRAWVYSSLSLKPSSSCSVISFDSGVNSMRSCVTQAVCEELDLLVIIEAFSVELWIPSVGHMRPTWSPEDTLVWRELMVSPRSHGVSSVCLCRVEHVSVHVCLCLHVRACVCATQGAFPSFQGYRWSLSRGKVCWLPVVLALLCYRCSITWSGREVRTRWR